MCWMDLVGYEITVLKRYLVLTVNSEFFARVLFKASRNGEITLSFTESPIREFYGGKYLLTLFAKIKFSRKMS